MSRLNDLLRQVGALNPELASDLAREVASERPRFGLVFERHRPEAVELPGRPVRRGDKVRILPPRGPVQEGTPADKSLWRVSKIQRTNDGPLALLTSVTENPNEPAEQREVLVDDLFVVAEFTDPIYPGLVSTGSVSRGGDKPAHTVINAENYHALKTLTFTHAGKVDAIYIDPPYNTRAKDWKYNNDYVDKEDDYRHSKWLSFMERRLRLSKGLLNPADSVLIVTIDEKEVHRLGLLLSDVFPEATIQMVSIVINPNGVARGAELARVEEYAFFCFFGAAKPLPLEDPFLDQGFEKKKKVRWEWLMRGGSNSRRMDRPNLFYPIYIDPNTARITEVGEAITLETPVSSIPERPGLYTLWPIRESGEEANWRTSPEYLRELLAEGKAKLGAYNKRTDRWSVLYLGKAQLRRIESGELNVIGHADDGSLLLEGDVQARRTTPKTVWNRPQHSAGEYGSRLVSAMLPGRDFPFPKSLYAVEDALRLTVGDKPNATVLDFFAGSGTTAHAVMRLNHQDNGQRQCISVTNNEVAFAEQEELQRKRLRPGDPDWEALGICDYITKPRIETAITGKTPKGQPIKGTYRFNDEFPMADGFEENAEFFTLTYETPISVSHNRAFSRVAPLLWMRAGSQGSRIDAIPENGWAVADHYGILFDLDATDAFCEAIEATEGIRVAFIITNEDRRFQTIAQRLPDHIEPVRLYEAYLSNFRFVEGD